MLPSLELRVVIFSSFRVQNPMAESVPSREGKTELINAFHEEAREIGTQERRRYEPWNNIDHPVNTGADRSASDLGIQQ